MIDEDQKQLYAAETRNYECCRKQMMLYKSLPERQEAMMLGVMLGINANIKGR